ncbi:MAG: hypothetical protein ABIT01_09825, partial [Thermoanaerobaculia bacterium]
MMLHVPLAAMFTPETVIVPLPAFAVTDGDAPQPEVVTPGVGATTMMPGVDGRLSTKLTLEMAA